MYDPMFTFANYQVAARETDFGENRRIVHLLGLPGEVGEVCELIKKATRDQTFLDKVKLAKELGDVLWYVAIIASDHDLSLSDIAQGNLEKLADRKARGTLSGAGDNR